MFRKSKDAPPHYFENMFDLLKQSRENASDPSMIDITYDDANNTFVIARQTNDRRAHVGCKIASLKKEQRVLIRGDGKESAIDGGCLLQMFKFVKFQTGEFLQGTIRENDGLSWDEDFPFTSALSKVLAARDVTWTLNQLCDKKKGFRARRWLRETFDDKNEEAATEAVIAAKRPTAVGTEDPEFTKKVVSMIKNFVQINLSFTREEE